MPHARLLHPKNYSYFSGLCAFIKYNVCTIVIYDKSIQNISNNQSDDDDDDDDWH